MGRPSSSPPRRKARSRSRRSRSGSRNRSRSRSISRSRSPKDSKKDVFRGGRRSRSKSPAVLKSFVHPSRAAMIGGGRGGNRNRSRSRSRSRGRRDAGARDNSGSDCPALFSVHQGTVKKTAVYGCFLEMDGFSKHGLVHISQLCNRRVEKTEDVVSEGDRVWVKVLALNDGKISLSLKDVDQGSGKDLNPTNDEPLNSQNGTADRGKLPKLNSIHKGICKTVREFGAFIAIPGFYSNGLVHITQLAKFRVENVSEVLKEGDTNVWVKVINLDDGKISLSMKVVDQSNGRDLDPYHEETERTGNRKKGFGDVERQPLRMEAVLNTTCANCGGKGHLASECMVTAGQSYELLSDGDDAESGEPGRVGHPGPAGNERATNEGDQEKKKGKKEKKSKKEKKKKEKNPMESLSKIEEAMRILAKAEKRQKKKEKKKKKGKKKKGSSSSSSDSD